MMIQKHKAPVTRLRIPLSGLLLLIPLVASVQGQWTSLYGTVWNALGVDFTDTQHGFAVGPTGKALRTVNGGTDWTASDVAPGETLLGVDFVNADTGWVWGDSSLFKTIDGGATWARQDPNRQRYADFQFRNGTFGFSKSYQGPLQATVDGGKTWRVRLDLPMGKPFYSFSFTTPAVGFAVAVEDTSLAQVYLKKTVDSGVTWTPQTLPPGLSPVSVRFLSDASHGWVSAKDTQGKLVILSTVDGGANWRRRDTQYGGSFFDVRFATAALGYFLRYDGNARVLVISRDSGATWAPSAIEFPGNQANVQFVDSLVGYATGLDFIMKTADGGVSWSQVYKGVWSGMSFSSIRFADASTGWVADTKGSVLKSRDGGKIWSLQVSGRTVWTSLAVAGAQNVAVAGYLPDSGSTQPLNQNVGVITRSKDGGATWKETRLPRSRMVTSLHFPSAQAGYAACYKPGTFDSAFIWKSTDGGDSWRSIVVPGSNRPLRVQFLDNDVGYLGMRGYGSDSMAGALKTVDGGETWIPLTRLAGMDALDMFWLTADRGWFLTYPLVYATVDGGLTWTRSDSLKQPNMQAIRFTDANNGWIITTSSVLLYTSDGGRTWKKDPSNMGGMEDVFFLPSGEGWAAGVNGGINHYKPTPTAVFGGIASSAAQPLFRRTRDAVLFTLDRPGHVRMIAVDATGRLRMPIVDGRYPVGTHRIPFNPAASHGPWFISATLR